MVDTLQAPTAPAAQAPEPETVQKLCIILTKGTLDMAYPAFMLAQTAAAMGREVHVFFSFWGMTVVDRRQVDRLRVSPVGNPAMHVPNLVGVLPGVTAVATRVMRGRIGKARMPPIPDMMRECKELGVHLHACSTTMEVMGVAKEHLVPEVEDVVGAASMLALSEGAQTLFI